MQDAKSIAKSYVREYANLIKSDMDKDFGISHGIAQTMLACEDKFKDNAENIQYAILKNVLIDNPSSIASFLQWDLSDCDTSYNKPHGRRRYICYRKLTMPSIDRNFEVETTMDIDSMKGIVDTADYNPENSLVFYTMSPIKIGNANTSWSIGICVPVNVIMAEANRHFYISIIPAKIQTKYV